MQLGCDDNAGEDILLGYRPDAIRHATMGISHQVDTILVSSR